MMMGLRRVARRPMLLLLLLLLLLSSLPLFVADNATATIPTLLHQSWRSADVPRRFAPFRASWRACAPPPRWRARLWTDAGNRALFAGGGPVSGSLRGGGGALLAAYDGMAEGVMRADMARFGYMLSEGGVYADLGAFAFAFVFFVGL